MVGVKKVQLRCKNCKSRSWMHPEIKLIKIGKYNKRVFCIKCPKCLASGEFSLRRNAGNKVS